MKNRLPFFLLFLIIACNDVKHSDLKFSTKSDAVAQYKIGWVQIMDEGRYGASEISYRKALEYDPDFLVGKSVLARLTLDLKERLKLYDEIQSKKKDITGDERLILEVYTSFVKYTNLRDQGALETKNALQEALQLAEKNLKKLVHKYPKEVYLKAEYIEMLHALYGPRSAIDSLTALTTAAQKDNPFLLGFAASMHAELEAYDIAIKQANRLKKIINDSTQPKSYAVFADIYFQKGNLEIAKINADKATLLDPRNLDASRLKNKIDQAIAAQNKPTLSDIK